ncbi:MAG: hypothetical protein ACOH5I_07535 [Oligoflexus sp.]
MKELSQRVSQKVIQAIPEEWKWQGFNVKLIDGTCLLVWLIVDEGGQSVPEVAVGAMMRFQKIVVVGDT